MVNDKFNIDFNSQPLGTFVFYQILMRLRHKQPLNSYQGQTNNDRNEFNDDDFKQQTNIFSKNSLPNTQQVYKYARILAKFMKNINSDVVRCQQLNKDQTEAKHFRKSEESGKIELKKERKKNAAKKQQLSEVKQSNKLQSKILNKVEQKKIKSILKKKQNESQKIVQSQTKNLSQSGVNSNKLQSLNNLNNQINKTQQKSIIKKKAQINQNITKSTSSQLGRLPQFNSSLNGNQISQNTIFNNFAQNFNGQIPNMNIAMQMNPIQMMKIMFGQVFMSQNSNIIGLNLKPEPYFSFKQTNLPNFNLFELQFKIWNQTQSNNKNLIAAYPLKKSANHVSISYKIYLDKLSQQKQSKLTLEQADPTLNARRVRTNAQNKAEKESQKKKK